VCLCPARSNNAFDDDDDDADETPEFFLPEYHYTTWDHDPDLVEARHLIRYSVHEETPPAAAAAAAAAAA